MCHHDCSLRQDQEYDCEHPRRHERTQPVSFDATSLGTLQEIRDVLQTLSPTLGQVLANTRNTRNGTDLNAQLSNDREPIAV